MKWAVYWQPNLKADIECVFFPTEEQARARVKELIAQAAEQEDEGVSGDWDITLLKVVGEVRQVPFDGDYRLKEVA